MFNKEKYNKLFDLMNEEKIDAIMIAPSSDMEYLIDYKVHLDERLNVLVILKDRSYFHITSLINYEEVSKRYPSNAKIYKYSDAEGYFNILKKAFDDYKISNSKVGINNSIRGIDILEFNKSVDSIFINCHPLLEKYRIIKTPEQIENMKYAAKIADEVMTELKDIIKIGMYEYEVIDIIKNLFIKKGADGLSFDPIVAAGKNSSMPHYSEFNSKIKKGDCIVVDIGCRYKNMCSDTSRTYFMGDPSEFQKKIYEICLRSTLTAQNSARKGMKASDLDKIARDIIENEGYGENFLNRTGHGIGFSVHEAPDIKGSNDTILEENMAFSIEPGIYIKDKLGMRVENIVIIENGVGVSLNNSKSALSDVIIKV